MPPAMEEQMNDAGRCLCCQRELRSDDEPFPGNIFDALTICFNIQIPPRRRCGNPPICRRCMLRLLVALRFKGHIFECLTKFELRHQGGDLSPLPSERLRILNANTDRTKALACEEDTDRDIFKERSEICKRELMERARRQQLNSRIVTNIYKFDNHLTQPTSNNTDDSLQEECEFVTYWDIRVYLIKLQHLYPNTCSDISEETTVCIKSEDSDLARTLEMKCSENVPFVFDRFQNNDRAENTGLHMDLFENSYFRRKYLNTDENYWNNRKLYKCTQCSKNFLNKYSLISHSIVHSDIQRVVCNICLKKFANKYSLSRHMNVHRREAQPVVYERPKPLRFKRKPLEDSQVSIRCETQNQLIPFETQNQLKSSETQNQLIPLETQNQSLHSEVQSRSIYSGDQSQSLYSGVQSLSIYCETQSQSLPFEMQSQPTNFEARNHPTPVQSINALAMFKMFQSPSAPPVKSPGFRCSRCPRIFLLESQLAEHTYNHVLENRCTVCLEILPTSRQLAEHMLRHGDVKQLKCKFCPEVFPTRSALHDHTIQHRQFSCTVCRKGFTSETSYRTHMLLHGDERKYKCTLCFKAFTQNNKLVSHMTSHTLDKNFKCHLCPLSFKYKNTLMVHLKKHAGGNAIECKLCPQKCYGLREFKRHAKTHRLNSLQRPTVPTS